MISLRKDGQEIKLYPDTVIDLEIECDILNFDEVEGTFTFPFTVPNDSEGNNRRILGFPDIVESRSFHKTKQLEGWELCFGGNVLYKGTLVVEDQNERSFELVFYTGASQISEFSDKKIKDIISHVIEHGLSPEDFKAKYYGKDGEFVFPWLFFRDYPWNRRVYERNLPINYEEPNSPQFKLWYVLEKLFLDINFPLRDKGLLRSSVFRNIIVFSNATTVYRVLRNQIVGDKDRLFLKNYMPDITFKDFIQSLRYLFGFVFIFSQQERECSVKLIKDIINDTFAIDWTKKTTTDRRIKDESYNPIVFRFDFLENYAREGENPDFEELEQYSKLPTVVNLSDLGTPEDFDATAMVLSENSWYWVNFEKSDRNRPSRPGTEDVKWEKFSDAVFPFHEIDKNGKEFASKVVPMRRDDAFVRGLRNVNIRNNNGKIRISYNATTIYRPRQDVRDGLRRLSYGARPSGDIVAPIIPVQTGDYVMVISPDSVEKVWAICTASKVDGTLNQNWADIDLTYQEDTDGAEILVREDLGMQLPDWSGLQSATRSTAPPYLLLYHGFQPNNANTSTYPYASPDNYNSLKQRIGDLALRWNGRDGLIEHFWTEFLSLRKTHKVIVFQIQLDFMDIFNFDPTKKVIIRGNTYLVKKISVPLRMDGIGIAEVEMRKV